MAEVFLSYASEDRDRVRPLAEALMARGFDIWWDRALASGDDFSAVIERELAKARAVIVVWTRTSVTSPWVRDEAGRARDDGRLLPVLLDKVDLPLGFGTLQAEDFSSWNRSPAAAQVQLLEEALRARLEGRSVDGGAVAAKRRRLMNRVRLTSVLGVVLTVALIGANVRNVPFLADLIPGGAHVVRPDRAQLLLELVRDGKITPEQAIELARLLESQAFATAPTTREARVETKERRRPPAARDVSTTPAAEPSRPQGADDPQVAQVSASEFDAAARMTARQSWAELLAHPDQTVRTAAVQLRNPATLDQAMRTLWDYAAAHPGPTQATIYRICGAVGEANNHPLGLRALERARDLNPQNSATWRMLSYGLHRDNRAGEAQAAALVGEGLEAQSEGRTEAAERSLQQALPSMRNPEGRAFVEGQLGDAAAERGDWDSAVARYESAFSLRERRRRSADAEPAPATLNVDAQKLVRAYDRGGRTQEACRAVARAQDAGVENPDAEISQRCVRLRFLRPGAAQATTELRKGAVVPRAPSAAIQGTN